MYSPGWSPGTDFFLGWPHSPQSEAGLRKSLFPVQQVVRILASWEGGKCLF